MGRNVIRAALLLAAAIIAMPASASALTFGADLSGPPVQTPTCPQIAAAVAVLPPASPSCMVTFLGTSPATLSPPGSGTVTAVRVRAGANPGPMRINVVRFLFQQTGDPARPSSAGPFLEAYGPQFTPAANAVTTVPTSLAMTVTGTPDPSDLKTVQVIDFLALEILGSNIGVPLYKVDGALTYPVFPGPTGQSLAAPSPNALTSFTTAGAGVGMSADFEPSGNPNVTPTPPTSPGTGGQATGPTTLITPKLLLPATTARLRDGGVSLPITCQGADCAGLIQLLSRGGAAATTTYGSAKFTLKAGAKKQVRIKLNAKGRALVKRRKKVTFTAKVTFSKGGGATQRFTVTVKR